jgi:hypothetical protein
MSANADVCECRQTLTFSSRIPTTHVLKPPSEEFEDHAENEHFCLELARSLGLPVVDSRIMHFKDEIAIVVERYDRDRVDGTLTSGPSRGHQPSSSHTADAQVSE